MSLPPPSGFAIRRMGSCPTNEVDCGATAAPYHACCPSGSSCPPQYNIDCCPSPANCTLTLLEEPRCANASWTLYDNHGYFCCAPGTIGYNDSRTFSDGCAAPGTPPQGAEYLAVVSAGQTATTSSASSAASAPPSSPNNSPDSDSSSSNTGAIAGGVIGGIAAIVISAIIAFYLYRKRKNRSLSDGIPPRDHRGGNQEKEATSFPSPKEADGSPVHRFNEADGLAVPRVKEADGSALHELPPSNIREGPRAELQ
ncbi:MAG: hypothetical protein Q9180_004311 [Flavoplaca navasiana]